MISTSILERNLALSKRRYDAEQARQIIADKAALLFSQKGYSNTSIEDISRASGYSKGHIYYHFENKEKLFVFLAQKTIQQWKEKWLQTSKNYSTATEKLYGIAHHVLYNYQTPLLRAGQELGANPKTSATTVQQLYGLAVTPIEAYQQIIKEGMVSEEFKSGNVERITLLLSSWLGGLCLLTHTVELQKLEPLFEEAITMFLASIRKI